MNTLNIHKQVPAKATLMHDIRLLVYITTISFTLHQLLAIQVSIEAHCAELPHPVTTDLEHTNNDQSDSNVDVPLVGASDTNKCVIFRDIGRNDLSITDIVVKSGSTNIACIKARFSLAIKVEELAEAFNANPGDCNGNVSRMDDQANSNATTNHNSQSVAQDQQRILLGYLPLDSLISVEDTCPDVIVPPSNVKTSTTTKPKTSPSAQTDSTDQPKAEEPTEPELKMIATFQCGKLTFTFKRDDDSTRLSLDGLINLDQSSVSSFKSEEPMIFHWEPSKHFKYNDLIEIKSVTKCREYILTANFYNFEVETFRTTTSRDFIRPPDEGSSISSQSAETSQQEDANQQTT